MIQIRNVPEALHRKAKARAAASGMTMSNFLLREIEVVLSQPTQEEVLARIASLPKIKLRESAADAVRAERDSQ